MPARLAITQARAACILQPAADTISRARVPSGAARVPLKRGGGLQSGLHGNLYRLTISRADSYTGNDTRQIKAFHPCRIPTHPYTENAARRYLTRRAAL